MTAHAHAPAFQTTLFAEPPSLVALEPKGVVYTKPWVVELLLDLAGYVPAADLAAHLAVEPAAGDGAFAAAMARRLVASCLRHGRPIHDASSALLIYEVDPASADRARGGIERVLVSEGVSAADADRLALSVTRLTRAVVATSRERREIARDTAARQDRRDRRSWLDLMLPDPDPEPSDASL